MKVFALLVFLIAAAPVLPQQATECQETKRNLTELQRKFSDWAELNRYNEANLKILPLRKGENRVVFIGDSITDLWDEKGFGGFFPGRPYINRGISGQTTSQMLVRFRQDVIALKPKIVVILAGTNDIAGNTGPMTMEMTAANIASMSELASANGIRVVLSSVIPISDTVRSDSGELFIQSASRPPAKILALNKWLSKYASANFHTYLNYYRTMADENDFVRDGITFDGLHPNANGYAIMAPLAEQAIRAAGKK